MASLAPATLAAMGQKQPKRWSRWVAVAALILALLGVGFGLTVLVNSQAVIGNAHRKNAHGLEIVASDLESWPRIIREIARNQMSAALPPPAAEAADSKTPVFPLNHPDLGRFRIEYPECSELLLPVGDEPYFPVGARLGEGAQLKLASELEPGTFAKPGSKCFSTSVSLERLLDIKRTAPEFSNLLVTTPDGRVIAQLGETRLPTVKLPDFTPVESFTRNLGSVILVGDKAPAEPAKGKPTLDASPGAVRIRIADADYFAYIRPVQIDGSARKCPTTSPPPPMGAGVPGRAPSEIGAGQSGAVAKPLNQPATTGTPARPAIGESCQLFLVGLTSSSTFRRAWLAPPPLVLAGFGLALLLVLSLLPLIRLLLIGATESVSAVEVAAIVFGAHAAAGIAMLMLLFTFEVAGERKLARVEAEHLAEQLARNAGSEIASTLAKAKSLQAPATSCPTGSIPWSWADNIYEASFLTFEGSPDPSRRTCRSPLPQSTDVSGRNYFRNFQQQAELLSAGSDSYVVGQVRAQTDGVAKTAYVIAPENNVANPLLVSSISRTFLHPLMPPSQRFMVIDASDARLPVLFHSLPGRALHENLAAEVDGSSQLAQGLRFRSSGGGQNGRGGAFKPISFQRRYDGEVTSFSAVPVPHTHWVVLVFHPLGKVDAIAALTAMRALLSWALVSIVAMLASCWLLFRDRADWRCLWPFRNAERIYRRQTGLLLAGAALSMALALFAPAATPLPSVIIAAVATLGTYRLLQARPLTSQPLSRRTERSFRSFVLAMMLCVAAAPMVAFWNDARAYTRDLVASDRLSTAAEAIGERRAQVSALQLALGGSPQVDPLDPWKLAMTMPGSRIDRRDSWSIAEQAARFQNGFELPSVPRCHFAQDADWRWFCWQSKEGELGAQHSAGQRLAVTERPSIFPPATLGWVVVLVVAVGLATIVFLAVYQGLWALTGFGIPLDAVVWPKLVLDGATPQPQPEKNERRLAKRSLLVAPQRILRHSLISRPDAGVIDLAEQLLPLPETAFAPTADTSKLIDFPKDEHGTIKPRLIVTGIELTLRDPARRRSALGFLERADAALNASKPGGLRYLIIMAAMSPLERILDAFDTFEKNDTARGTMREELRWARLFENFTTFSFAPVDKIRQSELDCRLPLLDNLVRDAADRTKSVTVELSWRGRMAAALPLRWSDPRHFRELEQTAERNATQRVLVEELRWLPGNVIDGVLAEDGPTLCNEAEGYLFPKDEEFYGAHYSSKVIDWAVAVDPVTSQAAIEFLRANLIEYFEQCWASSTFAERVILDALAHGAYVNMRKALALQSLVRRGLVIFDPAPRLMSKSFAAFIRQAERPDTLAAWRESQPTSPWNLAKVPLLVVITLLLIGLAIAAAESGQELTALVPLLAAGAPAILSTLLKPLRS